MSAPEPFTPADLIATGSRLEAMASFPPAQPVPVAEVARWGMLMMWAAQEIKIRDQGT